MEDCELEKINKECTETKKEVYEYQFKRLTIKSVITMRSIAIFEISMRDAELNLLFFSTVLIYTIKGEVDISVPNQRNTLTEENEYILPANKPCTLFAFEAVKILLIIFT